MPPVSIVAALLLLGAAQRGSATATLRVVTDTGSDGVSAVSPDGSVVIGTRFTVPLPSPSWVLNAYRWKDGVLTDVPSAPNRFVATGGASYDGSVFVGTDHDQAFRWENGQTTPIGSPGLFGNAASDISWDGSTIVGGSGGTFFIHENGVTTPIGPGAANAVSGDGEVIVGEPQPLPHDVLGAFRWQDGVTTGLGDLDGGNFFSAAHDVSWMDRSS